MNLEQEDIRNGQRKLTTRKDRTENDTGYEIREDTPLPWGRIRRQEMAFPLEFMKVGSSFTFERDRPGGSNVYSTTISYCREEKNFHKKFVVRKIDERVEGGKKIFKYGCWRVSDLTEEEIKEKQAKIYIKL